MVVCEYVILRWLLGYVRPSVVEKDALVVGLSRVGPFTVPPSGVMVEAGRVS